MNNSVSNGDSCDVHFWHLYGSILYYSAYFKNILLDRYSNIWILAHTKGMYIAIVFLYDFSSLQLTSNILCYVYHLSLDCLSMVYMSSLMVMWYARKSEFYIMIFIIMWHPSVRSSCLLRDYVCTINHSRFIWRETVVTCDFLIHL